MTTGSAALVIAGGGGGYGGGGGSGDLNGAGGGGSFVAAGATDVVSNASVLTTGDAVITYDPSTDSCPPDTEQVNTSCGLVTITSSTGFIQNITTSAAPTSPTPPAGLAFPCGIIGFEVTGLPGGGHNLTMTLTFPASILPTSYWKLQDNTWTSYTQNLVITDNVVSFVLIDGFDGDDDGIINGTIVDPSGPAVVATAAPTPVVAPADFLTG